MIDEVISISEETARYVGAHYVRIWIVPENCKCLCGIPRLVVHLLSANKVPLVAKVPKVLE